MTRSLDHARSLACALLAIALAAAAASASPPREPAFMGQLFPPELIMRHGRAIGLSAEQRSAITRAVADTQAAVLDLQWEMQDAAQTLGALVSREQVDEDAAVAAAGQVMELETRVKQAHLRLLIRIKNELTSEQQRRLHELRAQEADAP
jgi:Spy/CpxP family protein refolding chaperone